MQHSFSVCRLHTVASRSMSRPQLYLIGCTTQVTAVLLTDTSKNQFSVSLITHTFSHDLDLHANFFMIYFVTNQHINLLLTANNNNGNVNSKSVHNNKQSVLEFDLHGSQKNALSSTFLSPQVHQLLDTYRELGPTTTSCCIVRQRLTRTLTSSLTRVSYVLISRVEDSQIDLKEGVI